MSIMLEIPIDLSDQELAEVKQDLAILLYTRQAASLGKAAKIAGLTRIGFQRLLAHRQIPINYTEADLEADLATLSTIRAETSQP